MNQRKEKKREIITRYVHEQLFNADIVLVVSNWENFLDGAKEFLPKDKLEMVRGWVEKANEEKEHGSWSIAKQFPFDGGGSIIWVKHGTKIGSLVHEVTHAAHHLLEKRDVPLSQDTEEVYAYLIEFLFNSLSNSTNQ